MTDDDAAEARSELAAYCARGATADETPRMAAQRVARDALAGAILDQLARESWFITPDPAGLAVRLAHVVAAAGWRPPGSDPAAPAWTCNV